MLRKLFIFIIIARRADKSWREICEYLVSGKNFAPSPEEQYRYLASELTAIAASPDIDL